MLVFPASWPGVAFKVPGAMAGVRVEELAVSERSLRMPRTTLRLGYYWRRRQAIRDRSERVENDVENFSHPRGPRKGALKHFGIDTSLAHSAICSNFIRGQ